MGHNPSRLNNPRHPVERVSWLRVQDFLKALNGVGRPFWFDLPTEIQWEYACRADSNEAIYPTSNSETTAKLDTTGMLARIAWYSENSFQLAKEEEMHADGRPSKQARVRKQPHPVGLKLPNTWGVYDMLGNVCEWCKTPMFPYPLDAVDKEVILSNLEQSRVVRGGGYHSPVRDVRCAYRFSDRSYHEDSDLGFRLVRVQEPS